MRQICPPPAFLLALLLLVGQWFAVVHAAEHHADAADHVADCALCLHASTYDDAAVPVATASLTLAPHHAVVTPDVAGSLQHAVLLPPAIRGPPAGFA